MFIGLVSAGAGLASTGHGKRKCRNTAVAAFESELGVQAPVGYWDPMGLARDGDAETFKRRRASEIKHGRIAMLAAMGYITPELGIKMPGELTEGLAYTEIPNGLKAIGFVPTAGWLQIFAYCAYVEFSGMKSNGVMGTAGTPGDFGFKVITSKDPEGLKKKLNAELANGRLAMMAIIGMFFQDGLTGTAWGDWSAWPESKFWAASAFESELGVQAPVGFWDPLGFSSEGNVDAFKRRRASEIKHGRIAMLATMGYITPELGIRMPGELTSGLGYTEIPNGLKAIGTVPTAGWLQILAYCAYVEFSGMKSNGVMGTSGTPGDFGFKVLTSKDPEGLKKKLNAELANGRLAMMAIIGMFFQDGLTGQPWGDWSAWPESKLWAASAFESELGVQAPVGFWDPLGFTRAGDADAFKRRRASEIKHGRISMLACMGYITPQLGIKMPGELTPGLSYDDIPNGLKAVGIVPVEGWLQILAYCAYVEFQGMKSNGVMGTTGTPGDFGFKVITSKDPATLEKKLNAEIANGRLAMMAIIGMFFQDGLTGSPWGDWSQYPESKFWQAAAS